MWCGDCVKGAGKLAQSLIGIGLADETTIQRRRDICRACEHATRNPARLDRPSKGLTNLSRCKLCGCFIAAKTAIADEACPAAKWDKVNRPSTAG